MAEVCVYVCFSLFCVLNLEFLVEEDMSNLKAKKYCRKAITTKKKDDGSLTWEAEIRLSKKIDPYSEMREGVEVGGGARNLSL